MGHWQTYSIVLLTALLRINLVRPTPHLYNE